MSRMCSLALLLLGSAIVATAPASADPRVVRKEFGRDQVVQLAGKLGTQATIGFEDNESIENIAIGDAGKWQITPNKRGNLLFVKPLTATARTNMTVITNRREYFFDLVAAPTAKAVYMLHFTYPVSELRRTAGAGGAPAETPRAAKAAALPDAAKLNFGWRVQGSRSLLPSRVYDDGLSTYLAWGETQTLPAILTRNSDGAEGPLNYAVRDGVIVIADVPAEIVLRNGKAVATLRRDAGRAPAPAGNAPKPGQYAQLDKSGTPSKDGGPK